MTEIEQLRKDIEQAKEIMFRFYKQDRQALGLGEMYDRLAKLEAEAAAKADPWAEAIDKIENAERIEARFPGTVIYMPVIHYARHLQMRIAELQAELAKRPVVYCMKNNLTGIYGKHFGLARIALFDIENPEVLAEWQPEPYTGEQS